jgi:hypothetical protein
MNCLLVHISKQLKGTAVSVIKHTIKLWREIQLMFHTNCAFNYYVKYAEEKIQENQEGLRMNVPN